MVLRIPTAVLPPLNEVKVIAKGGSPVAIRFVRALFADSLGRLPYNNTILTLRKGDRGLIFQIYFIRTGFFSSFAYSIMDFVPRLMPSQKQIT